MYYMEKPKLLQLSFVVTQDNNLHLFYSMNTTNINIVDLHLTTSN
jgi:hypothetical protein